MCVSATAHRCVRVFVCLSVYGYVPVCVCLRPTGSVCSVIQVMQTREWTEGANERRPLSIHLPSLIDLVCTVSFYWSMAWRCVMFVGWSWQPGDKAPQGTQERESPTARERERKREILILWASDFNSSLWFSFQISLSNERAAIIWFDHSSSINVQSSVNSGKV